MKPENIRALDTLEKELNQRFEKLWRIFSWCSGILVSITGGLIVAIRAVDRFNLYTKDRIILSFVVAIIGTYAFFWLKENIKLETTIRNKIEAIFQEDLQNSYLGDERPDKAKFGYVYVTTILGITALFTIWMDCII